MMCITWAQQKQPLIPKLPKLCFFEKAQIFVSDRLIPALQIKVAKNLLQIHVIKTLIVPIC